MARRRKAAGGSFRLTEARASGRNQNIAGTATKCELLARRRFNNEEVACGSFGNWGAGSDSLGRYRAELCCPGFERWRPAASSMSTSSRTSRPPSPSWLGVSTLISVMRPSPAWSMLQPVPAGTAPAPMAMVSAVWGFPDSVYGTDVVLATLTFQGLSVGTTNLDLSVTTGDNTEGFYLDPTGTAAWTYTTGSITVPEPASMTLLALCGPARAASPLSDEFDSSAKQHDGAVFQVRETALFFLCAVFLCASARRPSLRCLLCGWASVASPYRPTAPPAPEVIHATTRQARNSGPPALATNGICEGSEVTQTGSPTSQEHAKRPVDIATKGCRRLESWRSARA